MLLPPTPRWQVGELRRPYATGDYGVAETLSKAKDTSVGGMVEAGILASGHGKVRLLKPAELPDDWDPATDTNLAALLGHTDTNLTALLINLANITSNLNAQVQANSNILSSISQIVVDTDKFVQGLKRHWLLRSAFKSENAAAKTNAPPPDLRSPRQR